MTSLAQSASVYSDERRADRVKLRNAIEITQGAKRFGSGSILDVSTDGIAFRCYIKLTVGETYTIEIDKIGPFQATVVRHSRGNEYGAKFEPRQRAAAKLAAAIEAATR